MTIAEILRRDMRLFETINMSVLVTIDAYVGLEQLPGTCDGFPATMRLMIDSSLDRAGATAAIKREVHSTTGYEPARFRWKPVVSA